ncbi:MAG: DUF3224 domain-containing protein [Verrucomicrobiota bacterium]
MTTKANATIKIEKWDEQTFHEATGAGKLTRVSVTKSYAGDLQGTGTLEYLMAYGDGLVTFVGLERVVGHLGGRSGSFVLQINGSYVGGEPNESFSVLPDSATGELIGLRGCGGFKPGPQESYAMNFEYEFATK